MLCKLYPETVRSKDWAVSGITLVALVVTIIVLLILAGVTLNLVMGENGILGRAENSVELTNKSAIKEEVEMAIADNMAGYYTDGLSEEKTLFGYMADNLTGYETPSGATLGCENDGFITYTDKKGNIVLLQMYENGQVEITGNVTAGGEIVDTAKPKVKVDSTTTNSIIFTVTDNIGVVAYAITENETEPTTGWTTIDSPKKKTITVNDVATNQTYYVWAKDKAGNVSVGAKAVVSEKYTVTYDANGGSDVPTDTNEYEQGETVTVKFNTELTREGYTFLGWTDDSSNKNTAKYTSSGVTTFAIENANVTLYAVWQSDIGSYVDLGTDILDKTIALSDETYPLTDWRMLYKDGANVWLIMSDYLPKAKNSIVGTSLNMGALNDYVWNASSRNVLIAQLKDKSKWNNLLNNTSLVSKGATVTGAIDIETWVKAWNADGGVHLVATAKSGAYYISAKEDGEATDYAVSVNRDNSLFFPRTWASNWNGLHGYWFSSPSASGSDNVMYCRCEGEVGNFKYNYYLGVRPVVCMPMNLLYKGDDGVWRVAD